MDLVLIDVYLTTVRKQSSFFMCMLIHAFVNPTSVTCLLSCPLCARFYGHRALIPVGIDTETSYSEFRVGRSSEKVHIITVVNVDCLFPT